MKFHEYLDIVYINTNIELQTEFSLKKQALTRAIPDIIGWQRSYFKLLSYFRLVFGFVYAKFTNTYPTRTALSKAPTQEPSSPPDLKPVS